jgi:hypothetical protein
LCGDRRDGVDRAFDSARATENSLILKIETNAGERWNESLCNVRINVRINVRTAAQQTHARLDRLCGMARRVSAAVAAVGVFALNRQE